MMKLLRSVMLLAAMTCAGSLQAQLTIEITQGVDNPVPIGIVPFEWEGFGVLSEDITEIVATNLYNSGEFLPLDESNMLSMPHRAAEVIFRDWRFLNTEYLLIGRVEQGGDPSRYTVSYEFFDVVRGERLLGEVLNGSEAQLRDIAHKISDIVFERVTGVRGAFSTKLLYVEEQRQAGGNIYRLKMSDIDGQRAETLVESRDPLMSPAWSPDAERIAYVSFETGNSQIFIQNLSDGSREQITNYTGTNSSPVFSPDGTKLAFVSSRDRSQDVYVRDLRTGVESRVTYDVLNIETEPSWMPDGESIIFTSDRSNGNPQIYQVGLDTGFMERLTFEGNYNARARMLPDGDNMILVHRLDSASDFHISILNLSRGTINPLTETSLDESPSIAPNSSMVIYASKARDRGILNVVSIDGSVKYQLPSAQGDVREPAWSPFLD